MPTLSQITNISNITTNDAEALVIINAMAASEQLDAHAIDSMIGYINRAVEICWRTTDGKLLAAYGNNAAERWAKLGSLINTLEILTGSNAIIMSRISRPKNIAIVCGDGYVVDTRVPFDKNFSGTKWHISVANKSIADGIVAAGEAAVRASLAANN